MKPLFTRPRGMPDLLPGDTPAWQAVERAIRQVMHSYGYAEMRTPIIERTALFVRSIGEATDIVEKEMYSFDDRRGESLSLRPENTAGCVRAAIEGGLLQPGSVHRIWYQGPMFRYERPQLGRQRQFYQTGAEVYGLAGAAVEVELMNLSARLWDTLGIRDALQLEINTLGDRDDRALYRTALVRYFEQHRERLDADSVRRLSKNPLRILDSKNPDMAELIAAAPKLLDHLSEASRAHFATVQGLLDACGIQSVHNPRLVRGLDYYSHTVFEWTTDRLGAQSAVCAGGRYDGLLEQMGAPGVAGVGYALGMERMLALCAELGVLAKSAGPAVIVMGTDEVPAGQLMQLTETLRRWYPGAQVVQNLTQGSLKSQFKRADKLAAQLALVLGASEMEQGTVTLKPLRGGEQSSVPRDALRGALDPWLTADPTS